MRDAGRKRQPTLLGGGGVVVRRIAQYDDIPLHLVSGQVVEAGLQLHIVGLLLQRALHLVAVYEIFNTRCIVESVATLLQSTVYDSYIMTPYSLCNTSNFTPNTKCL